MAAKLSPATLAMWGELLARTPGSRLMLKSIGLNSVADRHWIDRAISAHGVDLSRVVILKPTATAAEHLACYDRIDVALDPTPYNGTTTTAESLWMGVPVLTLEGDRHSARVGSSLMRRVGLPEFVAALPEVYIAKAAMLAREGRSVLGPLRKSLRATAAATLCDDVRYASEFETALRSMWTTYCREAKC
jgi:predicted O-linked N-acetylglucosamine transferase (SPINDLY family)